MALGEMGLGELGLGVMGLGEMGQNHLFESSPVIDTSVLSVIIAAAISIGFYIYKL